MVGYEGDFSLADKFRTCQKQALKIEVQKLETPAKDLVACAMIARIEW